MQAVVQKKEAKLRHQQQLALAALLKRIQRDRNEQLKHRQQDSQRLIQRNKNILNDLLNKQNAETKRTLENLKQTLGMTKLDKLYEPESANHPKQATMLPPGSSQSKKRPQVKWGYLRLFRRWEVSALGSSVNQSLCWPSLSQLTLSEIICICECSHI